MLNIKQEIPPEEFRRDEEPPAASAKLGWRYHQIGIPASMRPTKKSPAVER